ncbi:MAG: TetR/AcrR family transcriptional regulator [Paracoccaceae bacterium]
MIVETKKSDAREMTASQPLRGRPPTGDKRAQIIAAARQLLSERRYEDASVAEIVKRANVAQGTFYRHFVSKAALIDALTDEVHAKLNGIIERHLAADAPPFCDRLEAMILEAWQASQEYADVIKLLNTDALLFGGSAGAEPRRNPLRRRLAEVLSHDQDCGLMRSDADPDLSASIVIAVLDQVARETLRSDTGAPPSRFLDQVAGFIRRALAPAPPISPAV